MSEDLKPTIEALNKAFADFKAEHGKEIAEIKAKGEASAETKAAVEKVNATITEIGNKVETIQKAVKEVETAQARIGGLDARDPEVIAKERASVQAFLASVRNVPMESVQVTDQDVTAVRNYSTAFASLIRRGGHDGRDLPAEVRASLSVGSDPDGGYRVPPDMSGRIAQLVYESSPMRQIATVETTNSDRLSGINDLGEAGGGWVGESATRSETTTPQIGKWEIPVHELYANPSSTQKAIDDIPDVESWLSGKVADKLARLEATAFITGNGISKPRGFTTYAHASAPTATVGEWQRVEQTNTGVSAGFHATLPGDVFHTVIGKTKAQYLANARWLMNRTTLAATRKIKDGDGTYLWEKSFQANQPFQLLGYPVTLAEDMAAIAAASLSIAFGDFRAGYQIVDRLGIRVLRDPYTNKPFVHFYTTRRVGGDVVNFEALKLIKFDT